MRTNGNTSPANTQQLGLSPLLWGIDSLYLNYYGIVPNGVYELLSEQGVLTIRGMGFRVKRKRQGVYRFVLDNECLNIALGNTAPWQTSPSVYVQMKSAFIWSEGIEEAHRQTLDVVSDLYLDAPHREQVSRVDFFADIHWLKPFLPGDMKKFCKRAKKTHSYDENGTIHGFTIGKGKLQARIYNKAREARKSGKNWLFELWGIDENGQVWRVEFQLRREALREFGIETFDDLMNALQGLWDYCTGKWLYVRATGKNKARRDLIRFWETVQAAKFDSGDNPAPLIKREKMRSGMTERQAANQIGGIVESYARSQEIEIYSKAFNQLIPCVRKRWIGGRQSTARQGEGE